jgi:hypothetical protein
MRLLQLPLRSDPLVKENNKANELKNVLKSLDADKIKEVRQEIARLLAKGG